MHDDGAPRCPIMHALVWQRDPDPACHRSLPVPPLWAPSIQRFVRLAMKARYTLHFPREKKQIYTPSIVNY